LVRSNAASARLKRPPLLPIMTSGDHLRIRRPRYPITGSGVTLHLQDLGKSLGSPDLFDLGHLIESPVCDVSE